MLWSINLRADYGDSLFTIDHCPVIASFKMDDTLDVFIEGGYANYPNIQTDFGRAYAVKVGLGHGPDWSMFQHDYTRSNCVCNPSPYNGVGTITKSSMRVVDYPNPFSDNIIFNITLSEDMEVSEQIFNAQGKSVKSFINGKLPQGNHQFIWNGKDDEGNNLAGGIYFCQIIAGNRNIVKKIVLLR